MEPKVAHFACKCGQLYDLYQDPYRLRYPDCAKCGEMMEYIRDIRGRRPTFNFDEPIIMYSVGLHPDEKKSFTLANREIDLTPDGVPIAHNRAEKKQILKYFGYQENN